MKPIRIAVDFDGTIVKHEYPEIGEVVPHAIRVLKRLKDTPGVILMLWTMRCDGTRACLTEAKYYCQNEHDLTFKYINEDYSQKTWSSSPKLYAAHYIDDAAVGCPLIIEPGSRPYVDWLKVEAYFEELQILKPNVQEATNTEV